jgi:hypothetical protein
MKAVWATLFLVWPISVFPQCGFVVKPVSATAWYRRDGWQLPGLDGAKVKGPYKVSVNGNPPAWPRGVTLSEVIAKHKRANFPEVQFENNGTTKRMEAAEFGILQLWRWDIDGKPYAYSYELARPGLACEFSVDILDNKGDGIFRIMSVPGHPPLTRNLQPPPVPEWGKPKS